MTSPDLARRKRGPICGSCDRRYLTEGHAAGCAAHADVERKRRALAVRT